MTNCNRLWAGWYATTVVTVAMGFAGCQRGKYVVGRDTVAAFGDGRFQIVSIDARIALEDNENELGPVMWDVTDWVKDGDLVRVANCHGEYVVLNYRTGDLDRYASLEDVPWEHKAPCGMLKTR